MTNDSQHKAADGIGGESPTDVVIICGSLRVVFDRCGDRFSHKIEFLTTGLVLQSIEGASDNDWPPSPPFQSLQLETQLGGKQTALLIGMAGRSHWSASVEVAPADNRLTFDIACRLQGDATRLGSTYRWFTEDSYAAVPNSIINSADPNTEIATDGPIITVRPTVIEGSDSRTIRWRYVVLPP